MRCDIPICGVAFRPKEGGCGGALACRARAGRALNIFFYLCPTGDLFGGALSAVRAQCNYLDV